MENKESNKRKRGASKGEFIEEKGERNKFSKYQLESLERKLSNWFERTRIPTVALTLLFDKDGEPLVKYSGAKWFEKFATDETVLQKFYQYAVEGMKNCDSKKSDKESGGTSEANHQIIGNEVFSFPVQEKCKLVGQLVKSPDLSTRSCWKESNRPSWWPSSVSFRSPNAGPQRMRVTEIDKVLSSYIKHSKPNDNDSDSFVITASEVLAESLSVDQGVQDEIKEFIKKSKWSPDEVLAFFDLLRKNDGQWDLLQHILEGVPKHLPFHHELSGYSTTDVNFWLVNQVPPDMRSSFLPIHVSSVGGNSLYESASWLVYNTPRYWPCVKLLSVKYGIDNFSTVLAKLKEMFKTDKTLVSTVSSDGIAAIKNGTSLEEVIKREVLKILTGFEKQSILQLVLLSISLSANVLSVSPLPSLCYRVENEFSVASLRILWSVDKSGQYTERIFPLMQSTQTGAHECGALHGCILHTTLPLPTPSPYLICMHCLRKFHSICVGQEATKQVNKDTWCCGCHISHQDLDINGHFDSQAKILKLYQMYAAEIKRQISLILKGNIFSWRLQQALNDKTDIVNFRIRDAWPFSGNSMASGDLSYKVARLASAEKRFASLDIDIQSSVVSYALFPEVAAFLINRLSNVSLFAARRLIDESKNWRKIV